MVYPDVEEGALRVPSCKQWAVSFGQARRCDLARDMYVLENLHCLGFTLILGEREKLARGLSHFIKKRLLCFEKGLSIIGQMVPHLSNAQLHSKNTCSRHL